MPRGKICFLLNFRLVTKSKCSSSAIYSVKISIWCPICWLWLFFHWDFVISSVLLLLIHFYCLFLIQSFYVVCEKLSGYCYLILETWFLEQLFVQGISSVAQSLMDSLQSLWGCADLGLSRVNFFHNTCYVLDRAVFRAVLLSSKVKAFSAFHTRPHSECTGGLQEKEMRQKSWPQMTKGICRTIWHQAQHIKSAERGRRGRCS